MLFNQREAERRARIGGQNHPTTGEKHAEGTRRAHRVVVGGGQRVEVAGFRADAANFVTATDAVVVVVMGARYQLRRPGTAAGELEKGHFIGRCRIRDKVLRRPRDRRRQIVFTAIVAQQHNPY